MADAKDSESACSSTCKRCKAKLITGLKCRNCNSFYHPSCAKKASNVSIIDENTIQCCSADFKKGNRNFSEEEFCEALFAMADENHKIDVHIMSYLIQQKDLVISELRDKVIILMDQIDLLKDVIYNRNNNQKSYTTGQNNTTNNDVRNNFNNQNKQNDKVSDKASDKNVVDTQNGLGFNIESINNSIQTTISGEESQQAVLTEGSSETRAWTEVVKKNITKRIHPSKPKQIVVGGNSSSNNNMLKTVPKKTYLFVSRLDPSTTVNMLEDYVKVNFPEVKCEPLKAKYPEHYSSFKITINEENLEKAMDSKQWPQGALVMRYFLKKIPIHQNET